MLKKILFGLVALIFVLAILFFLNDEAVPEGKSGPEAEKLADKLWSATGKKEWDQVIAIQWSYSRGNDYLWDKQRNLVQVKWKDNKVVLDPETGDGLAYKNDKLLPAEESIDIKKKARALFFNDSFWLIAPFKVRDPGTERFVVNTESGDALMVKYNSGGVTPGDVYLWHLDSDGMPTCWQMWVDLIPIGGLYFTWEGWKQPQDNLKISTLHKGLITIQITNLEVAEKIEDLNNGIDPFSKL